jgi:prepilin-type N-terminal cleavage/methylation domain-containing protein
MKLAIENRRSATSAALTLIELLVVIAIIGILAALLLPVLSKVKSKATSVTDMGNLKQMATAVHLHADDNQDMMPWSNWRGGDRPDRPGWLYTQYDTNNLAVLAPGESLFKVETGLFWLVLKQAKFYFCPLDGPQVPHFAQRPQKISSYVMNGAVNGYDRAETNATILTKLGAMDPSSIAFWEANELNPNCFNDGASQPDEKISQRHNQGAITAAFDGSVSFFKFAKWEQMGKSASKNILWCYPDSPDGH